uniref:hypothetical protein n=1 Tax=Thioalkalivibrio sp. ALE19 TaxID=1266909 RepID=UPI00048B1F04
MKMKMKMKMKIMALALVVPMAMGISGCGQDEGEGPKLDASSREDLRNTAMQAGLWLEREKGREAAKELDRGLGVYVDEGKEDKVDGLRAT